MILEQPERRRYRQKLHRFEHCPIENSTLQRMKCSVPRCEQTWQRKLETLNLWVLRGTTTQPTVSAYKDRVFLVS